ncbi:ABC transporter ATP-binding protein [Shouchella clausii]|nr:ABC transporter ATP-binding protein [Shouchella clausii]
MIIANELTKSFQHKTVIDHFTLTVEDGVFLAITGESGKGKTTLLNLLSLIEQPDKGNIEIDGVKNPSAKQTLQLRRYHFGYLFQNYSLMSNETVAQNIKLALAYQKGNKQERIKHALQQVGLSGYENEKVFTLSGGQQQRVGLARVIARDCRYIFADEPTGNLDIDNRDAVFELLLELNQVGKTIVMVTHDLDLAARVPRRIHL